jgi:hypothetical protein
MSRFWRIAGLTLALLFAQFVLAAHGVEHVFKHAHNADTVAEVCVECLALAGFQGAAPASHVSPDLRVDAAVAINDAVPPAPTFAFRVPFLSRAPPAHQS